MAAAIPTVAIAAAPVRAASASASARGLLAHLDLEQEAHSSTYSSKRFGGWIDADGDGEDTRTEVLKAESSRPVTVSLAGAVSRGRWVSPYDGTTVTSPATLGIDHLVPLKEAWVSGAASWTPEERAAFANDLDHAPALVAATKQALHRKGAKKPNAYLPAAKQYRCTYVKNYVAVKQRWGLSVDPAEKRALSRSLTKYCNSMTVKKAGVPDIASLAGTTAPPVAVPVATPAPIAATPTPVATPSATPTSTATTVPVAPTPVYTPPPAASPAPVTTSSAYYANCSEVRAAGKAPLHRGDPGYSSSLDRDGDGIACE